MTVTHSNPPPRQNKDFLSRYSNMIAYALFAVAVAFTFGITEYNQTQDQEALCKAGQESRVVQRSLVDSVYTLAIGAVQREVNDPPLSEQERLAYNAYLARANNFREDQYAKIIPSPTCEKYVTDENVDLPTPPTPPLTRRENN